MDPKIPSQDVHDIEKDEWKPTPIHSFEFEDDNWSFFPLSSDKDQLKSAEHDFLNFLNYTEKTAGEIEGQTKDDILDACIKEFKKYLRVVYPKNRLSIDFYTEDNMYADKKLVAKSNRNREAAYNHFLICAWASLLGVEVKKQQEEGTNNISYHLDPAVISYTIQTLINRMKEFAKAEHHC